MAALPGLTLQLQSLFSDTSIPIVPIDKILSSGSLVLFEPAHSSGPLTSVPATAASASVTLRNVARTQAAALTGGAESAMDGLFAIGSSNTADSFKAELTGKGAIHGIMSQTNHNNSNQGARIDVPTAIRDYMFAHLDHQFYFSRWARKTRLQTTTATEVNAMVAFNNNTVSISNSFAAMTNLRTVPTGAPTLVGSIVDPGFNALGNFFQAIAANGFAGTAPSTASQLSVYEALWGTPIGNGSGAGFRNIQESWIFYRGYIEDLTVSGRTYAQVEQLDHDLWVAAMAAGGRYNGDTFTAPGSY